MPATPPLEVHVVTHTHWDREWYHSASRFRQRLVALVDELLDAPDSTPFLLDGQTVVVEDYLAVRPDRARELAARLADQSIEAGPWFVLADELIPSGEALVRNLLRGAKTLRALGATAPPVLYSPDAFGHSGALPTLAMGFGLPLVILWRGYGGRRRPPGDTARWEAPDGSSVLVHHLPPSGYEFGSSLPADAEAARARWRRMVDVLCPRARTGVLLVMNGADHHARQRLHREAIDALAAAAAPIPVRASTLRAATTAITVRAELVDVPVVRGELRDSYGYSWALQGTFATRAYQKRRNAILERLLLRDAEPWVALARSAGAHSRRDVMDAAWTTLLLCHPHDTLCGTSTDAVARSMDERLADARAQAHGLRADALRDLLGHDADAAREHREAWRPALVVRNRAPRRRAGIAEIELETWLADAPVGPDSAGVSPVPRVAPPLRIDGGAVAYQVLSERVVFRRIEAPRHYPDNDLVRVQRAVAWLPEIGGYAARSFALDEDGSAEASSTWAVPALSADANGAGNDQLRYAIDKHGRLTLASADGSWRADDAIGFEDVGDAGDLYTHSPVGAPIVRTRFLGASLVHAGPLRAEHQLRWSMRVPTRVVFGGGSARRRSSETIDVPLRVHVRLDAGAPVVMIRVAADNDARDHRLRVVFATGIASPTVYADAMFGPILREPIDVPAEDREREMPPPTAPLHRYVSLFGEWGGCSVLSDGLAEYEAMSDGRVAITLVRAVGQLSRHDLPERPGHAGWPAPTPYAQCLGALRATFAIFPHGARSSAVLDDIERAAEDFLLPLAGTTWRDNLAPPSTRGGIELEGRGLAFSAAKESATGGWTVLRCVNITDDAVAGAWRLGATIATAFRARLDETPLEPLPASADVVHFTAAPREVVTILVR